MTLPIERCRSLEITERFLLSLLEKKKHKICDIRRMASACLRHFPNAYERARIAEKAPEWLKNDC